MTALTNASARALIESAVASPHTAADVPTKLAYILLHFAQRSASIRWRTVAVDLCRHFNHIRVRKSIKSGAPLFLTKPSAN